MTEVTEVTVVTVVTVVIAATVVTLVTVVKKQLCTPKNLNLPKTYLPTYLCNSSYCSDSCDRSDSSDKKNRSLNYFIFYLFCPLNCDKTLTPIVTKLKNSNSDKT